MNKAVIELLQEGLPEPRQKTIHDDLDALAGSWTAAEAKAFDKALERFGIEDE